MAMTIVLATQNAGKLAEFQAFFASTAVHLVAQTRFTQHAVAETGLSFVENALLKARYCSAETGKPSIADDSGLAVTALNGAPGIYSARYAGENASDAANNEKLLHALRDLPPQQRQAYFCCALVFLRHAEDPLPLIAQGIWAGEILTAPQGSQGFGYDPLFYVPEYACSAAELSVEEKQQLSHRGQAMRALFTQMQHAGLTSSC